MNDEHKIFELYLEMTDAVERGKVVEYKNGDKEWYYNHVLHRDHGPASEFANGDKLWYNHGKLHREDGPAITREDGYKSWYWHGKYYATPEAWAEALLKQRNEPHDAASIDAFLKTILKKDIEQAL